MTVVERQVVTTWSQTIRSVVHTNIHMFARGHLHTQALWTLYHVSRIANNPTPEIVTFLWLFICSVNNSYCHLRPLCFSLWLCFFIFNALVISSVLLLQSLFSFLPVACVSLRPATWVADHAGRIEYNLWETVPTITNQNTRASTHYGSLRGWAVDEKSYSSLQRHSRSLTQLAHFQSASPIWPPSTWGMPYTFGREICAFLFEQSWLRRHFETLNIYLECKTLRPSHAQWSDKLLYQQ